MHATEAVSPYAWDHGYDFDSIVPVVRSFAELSSPSYPKAVTKRDHDLGAGMSPPANAVVKSSPYVFILPPNADDRFTTLLKAHQLDVVDYGGLSMVRTHVVTAFGDDRRGTGYGGNGKLETNRAQ